MTTTTESDTSIPPETPATAIPAEPEADPSIIGPIASHIAQELTGLHRIGHTFVQIAATAKGNTITADLTRRRFDGDDCATQIPITLTIGTPTPIDPAPLPEQISTWSQEILNLWTDNDGPGPAT